MGKSSVSDLSEHVFDLIQELFAIDPMLLMSVMPQLEFKLKVNMHSHPDELQSILLEILGEQSFMVSFQIKFINIITLKQ